MPKVIWLGDGEISLTSTVGRRQQCCTGPSESGCRSAVDTDRCWDSSGFPGRQEQKEGDSIRTPIDYKFKTTDYSIDDFTKVNPNMLAPVFQEVIFGGIFLIVNKVKVTDSSESFHHPF